MISSAFAAAFVTSLVGSPALGAPSPAIMETTLGKPIAIGGERIMPLRVTEDSRCPARVNCIWAGRVILAARIHHGGRWRPVAFTLGTPVRVAHGTLILAKVEPGPRANAGSDRRPYRFTFAFTSRH